MKKKRSKFKPFKRYNIYEKVYTILFILSIISGVGYGLLNTTLYKGSDMGIDTSKGEDNFTIFFRNLELSAIGFITAGFSTFYFLFLTSAISSSALNATGSLIALPLIYVLGFLEIWGIFLIGLSGFVMFETKFFKHKSKLSIWRLLIYGIILLFVSSVVEYLFLIY